MEPNETQPEEVEDEIGLDNDELAAAMGFMTTLGEQSMMAEQEEQEMQGQEIAQQELAAEEEKPEVDPEEIKGDVMKEVKKLIKDEIGGIKDMLKEALNEEESD